MRKTIRNVTIVVPVLMTSCHESEKWKIGPVTAHTSTTARAAMNAQWLPTASETRHANALNHPSGRSSVMLPTCALTRPHGRPARAPHLRPSLRSSACLATQQAPAIVHVEAQVPEHVDVVLPQAEQVQSGLRRLRDDAERVYPEILHLAEVEDHFAAHPGERAAQLHGLREI